jgi:UDPglucose--hexose-1-phosphate uridylyltransferase
LTEIRRDYITNRIVISSQKNDKLVAPSERSPPNITEKRYAECLFCPGNEDKTPMAETVLVQKGDALIKLSDEEDDFIKDWSVRIFPSKEAYVSTKPRQSYSERPLYSEPAYGYHYTVVATPNHDESLYKMSLDQLSNVLSTIQDKVRWLYSQRKVSYVAVFMNFWDNAELTESHPHLEIITLPRLPPLIEQEAIAIQKSMSDLGICPICSVINTETGGPRQILSTEFFVAITPWASSHSYEFWIFPKKHQTSFLKATQKEISNLAMLLRCTMGGMARALSNPQFSIVFHISSEKKTTRQIHWHIEVYPRISKWGGLEHGMGVFINRISPEKAASELGEHSRKELATLIGIE